MANCEQSAKGSSIAVHNLEKLRPEELKQGALTLGQNLTSIITDSVEVILGSKWVLVSQVFFLSSLWAMKASLVS